MIDKEDSSVTRVTPLIDFMRELQRQAVECLVVIYGPDIGKKYDLIDDVVTIGRDSSNNIVIPHNSVSRQHAKIIKVKNYRYLVDLDSTNGTYVEDKPIKKHKLRSGDYIKIGNTIFKYIEGSNLEAAYHEEIYRLTITDGLTRLYNKRYLLESLEKEIARAKRYGRLLSLIMIDIDHFKHINDRYGHLTGDAVLKELGKIILNRVRQEEVAARYGGEEFVIILPETDIKGARAVAESIRRIVERHVFEFEGQALRVTISAGTAEYDPERHSTPKDLIMDADEALYRAKNNGRNRVE